MSDTAAPTTVCADAPADPPGDFRLLHRVRRWGYLLLVMQLAGLLAWSAILYSHFSVTWDFAAFSQPWYLIAHGNLDPYSSLEGLPFWQGRAEFIFWILAPLFWLGRSAIVLPWLQDASIVAAEAIAFTWICEVARRHCKEQDAAWLSGLGLLLLLANPWTWWAISFDIHEETLTMFFVAFLAWDLYQARKRRAWVWLAAVLVCGVPSATYAVGVGVGGALAYRRIRPTAAAIAAVGVAYALLMVTLHGEEGFPLAANYGYLAGWTGRAPVNMSLADLVTGMARHPSIAVAALWGNRADIIANLAPGGLLGIGAPAIMPLSIIVLLSTELLDPGGYFWSAPLFQSIPIYVLLPVGTVTVLAWLLRRRRRASLALAGILAAQAFGWAAVWGPRAVDQWLKVSSPEASTLATVLASIPPSAEVFASNGIVGRFSGRSHVQAIGPGNLGLLDRDTWFVIAPTSGIETLTPMASMAMIGALAGPLHATLVTHANGVWVFRLVPRPELGQVILPNGSAALPAWAAAGAAGLPVLAGQVSGWHMAATGAKGYVSDGVEWQEPAGRYRAVVTLSASGPVNVEVWDDTNNTLLARRTIPKTTGIQQVALPLVAPHAPSARAYAGWGPFRADFALPPPGQRLEVRVWSPGGETVNVYSAGLTRTALPAAPARAGSVDWRRPPG